MKKYLNICLVSREYPPDTGWGGIGTYTHRLAHGLADFGHQVHIIAQSPDVDKEYVDGKIHVHRIAHKTIFLYKGPLKEFALRLEYSHKVYQKLKEIMKKQHIDIVETPNFAAEGFMYSLFKKAPLVTRLHTHFSEIIEFSEWPRTFDRRLSCWLEDATILRSDLITCSTRKHKEVIFGEIGLDSSNFEIVPLGTPLPEFEKENQRKEGPIVLFVGRLEKRKGAHILIKSIPYVLEEIPEATFVLIGRDTFLYPDYISFDGEEEYSFKARLINGIPKQYRRNVLFPGHINHSELSNYFLSCNVFVAPSLYESFGLIYIEAMSYGRPVIGSSVGGVPEVIKDGETGFLVPPEDPLILADRILRLLNNKNLEIDMGRKSRKLIENNFTVEIMVQNTLKAYSKLLNDENIANSS